MARNCPPKRNLASLRDRAEMIGGEMRERLRPILAGQNPRRFCGLAGLAQHIEVLYRASWTFSRAGAIIPCCIPAPCATEHRYRSSAARIDHLSYQHLAASQAPLTIGQRGCCLVKVGHEHAELEASGTVT